MSITIPSTPFSLPTTFQLPPAPVNVITATVYTFVPLDAQAYTVFTAATTVNVTMPAGVFDIGTQITCEQSGVGSIVFTPAVGVTFNPTGPRGTLGQYAVVAFIQKFQNIWTCSGSFI